jgi:hypothetical protein
MKILEQLMVIELVKKLPADTEFYGSSLFLKKAYYLNFHVKI